MHIPKVRFTPWVKWSKRNSLINKDYPGVYLLAHFNRIPSGRANPYTRQIVYIGETCGSLKSRWKQFERTAFQGKEEHSGAITYRKVIGGRGNNLYVAAFPVDNLDKKIQPLFIRYIERKLIWNFVKKIDLTPKCNKK